MERKGLGPLGCGYDVAPSLNPTGTMLWVPLAKLPSEAVYVPEVPFSVETLKGWPVRQHWMLDFLLGAAVVVKLRYLDPGVSLESSRITGIKLGK